METIIIICLYISVVIAACKGFFPEHNRVNEFDESDNYLN